MSTKPVTSPVALPIALIDEAVPAPLIYDSAVYQWPVLVEARELLRYRDLLYQLVERNIKTRYKRSMLGLLWTVLNPLLMMSVLTLVFSHVFRITVPNYPVYALCGLVLWNFFAQTTSGAMSELIWGGSLLQRIYLPRAIFAASALLTGLVNLLLSLIPLFILMLVTGTPIKPALLFLPVPLILITLFAMGMALFLSTLAAYFTDVVEMYQVALTAWLYLTPIIYPKEIVPERYRVFLNLNPMYHLLEVFRAPIHLGVLAGPKTLAVATLVAVLTFGFGWWFFTRKADEIAYRI